MTTTANPPGRPRAMAAFEIVFLTAMAFYPVIALAVQDLTPAGEGARQAALISAMVAAQLVAMVLLSRRRRRWARWLVIALLVLDVPMYMAAMPETTIRDPLFLSLSGVQFALHFAAVFLMFTRTASAWLGTLESREDA